MSLFKEIEDLIFKLKGSPYISTSEAVFYEDEDGWVVRWNEDNNLQDLYNSDGNTYSAEIIGKSWEDGDCIFFNADTGCGETVTYVFKSSNKVDYDHLEEMFNRDEEE